MSSIASNAEDLILNADGGSSTVKIKINGTEKASISSAGAFTSTTIDATKLTGTIPNFTSTGIDDNATSTAITIDASENVGIGTTSPDTSLHVTTPSGTKTELNLAQTAVTNFRLSIPASTDALTFVYGASTERMRIDSSGNVGIGTTPETNTLGKALHLGQSANIVGASSSDDFWINNNCYYNSGWKYTNTNEACRVELDQNGKIKFWIAPSGTADSAISFTNALEILQYNQGLDMYRGVQIATDSIRSFIGTFRQSTSNASHIEFRNTNGHIGSIATNGTATSYNTSSDYRLKENVDYTWDATTRLKQLKPARFNFISDEDNTLVDGFLAHEVSSVVPEAISGTKDATETLSNAVVMPNGISVASGITEAEWTTGKADGTYPADTTWTASHTQDVWQSIDQAKLVPLLVKTIQELEARITTLEG